MAIDPLRLIFDPAYRMLQFPFLLAGQLTGQTEAARERLAQIGFPLETGTPRDPLAMVAANLPLLIGAGAVLAGVKVVADAYRTRKLITETWTNQPAKPDKSWYEKIPKKHLQTVLAAGLVGGAFILSIMQPPEKVVAEPPPREPTFPVTDVRLRPRREPPEPVTPPPVQPPPTLLPPPIQEIPEPPPEYRGRHR